MLPSDEIQELILQRRKTRRIKNKQQNQLIKQRQGSLNGFRIIQNMVGLTAMSGMSINHDSETLTEECRFRIFQNVKIRKRWSHEIVVQFRLCLKNSKMCIIIVQEYGI